jgi:UTP--glucose-1-phosphate uridylyltransferase
VKIRKAVITAAGERQRSLPLQTLIDQDGEEKSVLGILIEQALSARVEEISVVVSPGDEARYAQAAGKHLGRVRFVPQARPLGYGHAVYCARQAVNGEPFLHLVGDHLPVSCTPTTCAHRLAELAEAEECAVSAVQVTRENLLPRFGAVGGRRVPGRQGLYRIETVVEKPTPTEAERRLTAPGLRAGYYLCFFGVHVLTPVVMDLLERQLAVEEQDRRYDIGARYGLLIAQLALALNGRERAEVLAQLVELLAAREMAAAGDGQ